MRKSNMVTMKVNFEDIPIMERTDRINNPADLDDMVKDLKTKLFGRNK